MGPAGTAEAATFGRYARRDVVAGTVFAAGVGIELALFGLPLTPERFLVVPLVAAFVLGRARPYVRDFVPFLLLLLLYEELRGVAHILHPHPYFRPQIHLEQALFGGHLPTVELQHLLWSGHMRFYDHVIVWFSSAHFLVPPALAFVFWLKDRELFLRFTRTYLGLSFVGALMFLIYPSAPPWAASRAGVIPPVALLSTDSAGGHGGTGLLLHNPYAAIPSLHAGYAMLVFLFIAARVRRSRLRWPITLLAALYPVTMGFAVVYTGNHYVVDLLIGFAFAGAAYVAVPMLSRRRSLPSLRPRLVTALATAVLALTLATALATAAPGGLLRITVADNLTRSLATSHVGKVVDLPELMPFAWSRVYVFPADTQPQEMNRVLGFSWPEAAPGGTTAPVSRSAALLVFVRSGSTHREVVREVHYEGGDVRLDCLMGHSYARSDADFRVASRIVAPFDAARRALVPAAGPRLLSPSCLVSRWPALS